jgi:hypothetical protein
MSSMQGALEVMYNTFLFHFFVSFLLYWFNIWIMKYKKKMMILWQFKLIQQHTWIGSCFFLQFLISVPVHLEKGYMYFVLIDGASVFPLIGSRDQSFFMKVWILGPLCL